MIIRELRESAKEESSLKLAFFIYTYSGTRCSIRRAVVFERFLLPIVRQHVQFIIKRQKPSEVDTTGNEPGYYSPPIFMPDYELCGLEDIGSVSCDAVNTFGNEFHCFFFCVDRPDDHFQSVLVGLLDILCMHKAV